MNADVIKVTVVSLDHGCRVYSKQFDDIYFNPEDGRAESDYVFLEQNNLPNRVFNKNNSMHKLVITEFGFGTGLNFFLLLEKIFLKLKKEVEKTSTVNYPTKLIFNSVEKYPIPMEEMEKVFHHFNFQFYNGLKDDFYRFYPFLNPGWNEWATVYSNINNSTSNNTNENTSFDFNVQINLNLFIGDIKHFEFPITDIWLLDGFAPSKNPKMWEPSILNKMGEKSRPGTTFSTFTAAGRIRRALQQAGFTVETVKGYGRKREMLVGKFISAIDIKS